MQHVIDTKMQKKISSMKLYDLGKIYNMAARNNKTNFKKNQNIRDITKSAIDRLSASWVVNILIRDGCSNDLYKSSQDIKY